MQRHVSSGWIAAILLATGCTDPNAKEGYWACDSDKQCSAGYRCLAGACRQPSDAFETINEIDVSDLDSDGGCTNPCPTVGVLRCEEDGQYAICEWVTEDCLGWSAPRVCADDHNECTDDDCNPDTQTCGIPAENGTPCGLSDGTCQQGVCFCDAIAHCSGRACGSDGCGGTCGICADARTCQESTGLCLTACNDSDGDGYGVGDLCLGPDCAEGDENCNTDCTSDADLDEVIDCDDPCIDLDQDNYGVGPDCLASDCDQTSALCTTDCADADSDGMADCKDPCLDADSDGYGAGPGCNGLDCDELEPSCNTDCSDQDENSIDDCLEHLCRDADGDSHGVGLDCIGGSDCDDQNPYCHEDCFTDVDKDDIPDCRDQCVDADQDGYGSSALDTENCLGQDCDDQAAACADDCLTDADDDGRRDCDDACVDVDLDSWCRGEDCNDSAVSCTNNCEVDADRDGIADCADDCVDFDRDGCGFGMSCTHADCDDQAYFCCEDCATDSDSNGTPDCEQQCVDEDLDTFCADANDCDDSVSTCNVDCVTDSDVDGARDCDDSCVDVDGDGYGTSLLLDGTCLGLDCDDADPDIHPGAAETCNGLDDDCDGSTDAADSDDFVLEDLPPCDNQQGVCAGSRKTAELCVDGQWTECPAGVYLAHDPDYEIGQEILCDGLDNDCNGTVNGGIDEDFVYLNDNGNEAHIGDPCGTGRCTGGVVQCEEGHSGLLCQSPQQPQGEQCNDEDDDCDGLTDADDPDLVLFDAQLCEFQFGVCEGATKTADLCAGGAWLPCGEEQYALFSSEFEPLTENSCTDALDNDCNGVADCSDDGCFGPPSCGHETIALCFDNLDNDQDGVSDCADVNDCATAPACTVENLCGDGIDNDLDGLTDCYDPTCFGQDSCANSEDGYCDDRQDNDQDGLTDCHDTDCDGLPGPDGNICQSIERVCGDNFDNDADGLTDCADPSCADQTGSDGFGICEPAGEANCLDGFDNDRDGQIDCLDSQCNGQPCEDANPCTQGEICIASNCRNGAEACCDNGISDEGDPLVDCLDSDCDGLLGPGGDGQRCEMPEQTCDDGYDNDADGFTDCRDPQCAGQFGSHDERCEPGGETSCADGGDNDADGSTDCADSDCFGSACDDHNECTQDEQCVGQNCVGPAVSCADGNICSDDWCDPQLGCQHVNNTVQCEASSCDAAHSFHAARYCSNGFCSTADIQPCTGSNSCFSYQCNPQSGCSSQYLGEGAECGSRYCQGNAEYFKHTCQAQACTGSQSLGSCDDQNDCTEDTCAPVSGCQHTNIVNGTECGTRVCQGLEWRKHTCQAGTCNTATTALVESCVRNQDCKVDACSPTDGCSQSNQPDASLCGLGQCNSMVFTSRVCRNGNCLDTNPYTEDCGDMNSCTDDECNAASGCRHTFNDDLCEYGGGCVNQAQCMFGTCVPQGEACCDNSTDDDLDGATDCADVDCRGLPGPVEHCGNCGAEDGTQGSCADGCDNDGNRHFDCMDSGCTSASPCNTSCMPIAEISCGATVNGTTASPGQPQGFTTYSASCGGGVVAYQAKHTIYGFYSDKARPVQVSLTGLTKNLALFVLQDQCAPGSCIFYSENAGSTPEIVNFQALEQHLYYFVVDGRLPEYEGPFSLYVQCQ